MLPKRTFQLPTFKPSTFQPSDFPTAKARYNEAMRRSIHHSFSIKKKLRLFLLRA